MTSRKRACKNWLHTFLDWTLPVSESPESLLIWSGLFCLSAVLKKHVKFSREWLKLFDIYPNTYVVFVGEAGVVRKSTSAGYAQRVIERMNDSIMYTDPAYVALGPTSGSEVTIIEKMSESIDGAMTIISGEFENLVSTRPKETYAMLTKMFDADATAKRYLHSTRGHGDELIVDPCLNLLGCTIPDFISQNAGYMLSGGFAARTVYVFEKQARQRKLFYKDVGPSVEKLDELEAMLASDLAHIGNISGEFTPESDELGKAMDDWYQAYIDAPVERGVETFKARKHVHALRTAMLLSICESDDLVVTKAHFERAKVLIDYVERRLNRGLSGAGRNPYADLYYSVLDFVIDNTPVKKGAVMAHFWSDAPPAEISNVIAVLKQIGEIEENTATEELRLPSK